MKIYIVERDNPFYKPEPEVFTAGKIALETVKQNIMRRWRNLELHKKNQMLGMVLVVVIGILKMVNLVVMP